MVTAVEPRLRVRPPDAVRLLPEAVEVMEPVPVAVRVTLVPERPPAREMEELVPESINEITPEEVNPAAPMEMVAELVLSVSDREAGVLLLLVTETAVLVSVRVTLAVVLREMVPAEVVRLPMLPAPTEELMRERVPEVVRVPAD